MRKRPPTIDEALILGDDYEICEGVYVRQPTISEIIRYDEPSYYRMVGLLTCISSDCKAALDDIGLDWCQVSDFEMFILATRTLTVEDTEILLGPDVDLSKMHMYVDESNKPKCLMSDDGKIQIDEGARHRLNEFLCKMHQIIKKPEFPGNDFAREMLLEESREKMQKAQDETEELILPTLISFISNVNGSKYDYETCKELKYSMFMDSVARLQIIGNATALRNAAYSGWVDASKIDKEEMNMMRSIKLERTYNAVQQKNVSK